MSELLIRSTRRSYAPGRKAAAVASVVAAMSLVAALMAWMGAQVAEYPGVPRETAALPKWFTGESSGARDAPAPATAGKTDAPVAKPASAAAFEADFVDVAGSTIEIAFQEYELKPSRIRVAPGKVTFVLSNAGRFSHDFHVEGAGVDAYAAKFSPGRTVRLEVELQEGEYKLSCPLSNHDERGMHGTLIATARPAGK